MTLISKANRKKDALVAFEVLAKSGPVVLAHCPGSGASILGVGGREPQILGRGCGVAEDRRRVVGGREILLYLIMYRKYVRKW